LRAVHRHTPPAKGTIHLERRIAAPPETVFAYFTDPDRYRQWQGTEAELDPRPGGTFRVRMTGLSGHVASGVFEEVEPPTRVLFTWGWEAGEALSEDQTSIAPGASRVEVVLVPDGEGTILRLRHSGLPSESSCRLHDWGWDFSLDRLAVVTTGGDPGPNPYLDL